MMHVFAVLSNILCVPTRDKHLMLTVSNTNNCGVVSAEKIVRQLYHLYIYKFDFFYIIYFFIYKICGEEERRNLQWQNIRKKLKRNLLKENIDSNTTIDNANKSNKKGTYIKYNR